MLKKIKKGVTLIELTVVMALIAIISVLIVSFCELTKTYTVILTTEEVANTDLDEIKSMFDLWTTSLDKEGVVINITGINDNKLEANYDASDYYFTFGLMDGEKTIHGSCPNETDKNIKRTIIYEGTSTIKAISFAYEENEYNGYYALSINVMYEIYSTSTKSDIISKDKTFVKTLRCASVQGTSL